ncbi:MULTISPECIES: STAS/SEC14 domain-containing protein [unclassified Lysobacter]|jgi:hypothetical protein|uniref:STAS/SEC14 domain-containing protein n=1 Tax=unclassified Lysobacter TaxID=2635362 RepID=UPI001F5A0484|nr:MULTISPECIES: STAS/SEC14 domain-containing protein [unclassified Lysobacter]HEX5662247.1 STAS/SEC14 domain-containing protein [Xanthomonadaceae bacterium]
MISITRPQPDRVDVAFEGKLDAAGMRAALDELAAQSQDIERGRMLYSVGDFDFPSFGALAVELARIPQLLRVFRRFRRVAVVADAAWVRGISEFEGALFPGMELKAFPAARRSEAEAWLAG